MPLTFTLDLDDDNLYTTLKEFLGVYIICSGKK